jgi:hypothetical protein
MPPSSAFSEFPRHLAEQIRDKYPHPWAKHGTGGDPTTGLGHQI